MYLFRRTCKVPIRLLQYVNTNAIKKRNFEISQQFYKSKRSLDLTVRQTWLSAFPVLHRSFSSFGYDNDDDQINNDIDEVDDGDRPDIDDDDREEHFDEAGLVKLDPSQLSKADRFRLKQKEKKKAKLALQAQLKGGANKQKDKSKAELRKERMENFDDDGEIVTREEEEGEKEEEGEEEEKRFDQDNITTMTKGEEKKDQVSDSKKFASSLSEEIEILNENITSDPIVVINGDGKRIGIIPKAVAIRHAKSSGLELLQITPPNVIPSVCRLINYEDHEYQKSLKAFAKLKAERQSRMKIIQMRPTIDPHDYSIKMSQAKKFLSKGHTVRVSYIDLNLAPEKYQPFLAKVAKELDKDGIADDIKSNPYAIFAPKRQSKPTQKKPSHEASSQIKVQTPSNSTQTSDHNNPQNQSISKEEQRSNQSNTMKNKKDYEHASTLNISPNISAFSSSSSSSTSAFNSASSSASNQSTSSKLSSSKVVEGHLSSSDSLPLSNDEKETLDNSIQNSSSSASSSPKENHIYHGYSYKSKENSKKKIQKTDVERAEQQQKRKLAKEQQR